MLVERKSVLTFVIMAFLLLHILCLGSLYKSIYVEGKKFPHVFGPAFINKYRSYFQVVGPAILRILRPTSIPFYRSSTRAINILLFFLIAFH